MALTLKTSDGNGCVNLSFSGTPSAGDNELVAAISGKSIKVYAFTLMAGGTDNALYFKTGTDTHFGGSAAKVTVNVSGPVPGVTVPFNPQGHFTGGSGESLALTASTTQPVFGQITYKAIGG